MARTAVKGFNKEVFIKNISSLMKENNLTQKKIAEIMDNTTESTLSRYLNINESAYPSVGQLVCLADYFDVSLDWLIRGNDSSARKTRKEPSPRDICKMIVQIYQSGFSFELNEFPVTEYSAPETVNTSYITDPVAAQNSLKAQGYEIMNTSGNNHYVKKKITVKYPALYCSTDPDNNKVSDTSVAINKFLKSYTAFVGLYEKEQIDLNTLNIAVDSLLNNVSDNTAS